MNLLREKQRCADTHRLNFGGGSSSSTKQETVQNDNRITNGTNGIVAQGGSMVSVLDGGAISNALGFAGGAFQTAIAGMGEARKNAIDVVQNSNSNALTFAQNSNLKALDFATNANAQASATLDKTTSVLKSAYEDAKGRGAMTDYVLIAALAMAGFVAFNAGKK
jgi:hypothetical protein